MFEVLKGGWDVAPPAAETFLPSESGQTSQNSLLSPQGSYSLPQTQFDLPHVDLPYWLTNGHYRVQGVLGKEGKELGCLKIFLSLHSA